MFVPMGSFLASASQDPNDQLRKALLQMMMAGSGAAGSGISLGSRARGIGPDAMNARVPQLTIPAGMAAALPPGFAMAPPIGANTHIPFNPAPGGGLTTGMGGSPPSQPPFAGGGSVAGPPPQAQAQPVSVDPNLYSGAAGPFRRLFGGGRVFTPAGGTIGGRVFYQ